MPRLVHNEDEFSTEVQASSPQTTTIEATKSKQPACIACSDTGKSSSGHTCVPCWNNGRIKDK